MKKFLSFLKSLRKRLAIIIVTAWADYTFDKARRKADERHAEEGWMIYVASQPFRSDRLTTYDRIRFKAHKAVWGFHGRLLTLETLKNGCWYHTADTAGNQAMSEREIERRRKAFIKDRLVAAKLINWLD